MQFVAYPKLLRIFLYIWISIINITAAVLLAAITRLNIAATRKWRTAVLDSYARYGSVPVTAFKWAVTDGELDLRQRQTDMLSHTHPSCNGATASTGRRQHACCACRHSASACVASLTAHFPSCADSVAAVPPLLVSVCCAAT